MIQCGHCEGQHASVREVRECALDGDRPSDPDRPPDEAPPREHHPPPDVVLGVDHTRLAGPGELARNLLVLPGADIPAPWATAETVPFDDGPEAVTALRRARADRRRLVIELHTDLPDPDPVLDVDYWHLDPNTDLEGETARHLLLAHSVDARDPHRPTIRTVGQAVAAGATLATEGPGDIVTSEGPAWCDGGPLEWFDLDIGVIPAVHLARGLIGTLGANPPQADLAPDQLAAVAHSGGGARIIAPAGSGKTRVLTERARHLVRDRSIDPSTLCLLAYNVRAREEMEERTSDVAGLEIRTFNSLALAIQRGTGPFATPQGRPTPSVIEERQVRDILDGLVKVRFQAMADPFATWIEALTSTRLGLRSPQVIEKEFAPDVKDFASVLAQFRDELRRRAAVDFDDQILGAIEILCTDPDARRAARQACGVLLVDEFQDLTPAHVLLIRLLAGPAAEVFGVGDDDQTIYGYSGASPEWLIDFPDLFPGAAAYDLHVNYRCPPPVVDGAMTLLTHNRRRISKDVHSPSDRTADPTSLTVDRSADPLSHTVDRVTDLIAAGARPADIAVLTRVNATLLGPMVLLEEAGIPTSAPVGVGFMERTGVAGAVAWIELATGDPHRLGAGALEAAVSRPPRGISARLRGWVGEQRDIGALRALASRLKEPRDQKKIDGFADDVEKIRSLAADGATTEQLLVAVRDEIGLGPALDERLDASRRSVDRSTHGDDLASLLAIAHHQHDPESFPAWLRTRLESITDDPLGVRLSTIHRVKGREWLHVIVHDATDGLMPHRLASNREEERRVFHVAVTRGIETVTVVAGDPASPFVAQLTTPRDPNAPDEPEPTPRTPVVESKPPRRRREVPEASTLVEASLREKIRAWRLEMAKAADIPAFVVFTDETLYALAAERPLTENELLDIKGIGPVKVERYGAAVIELITAALED